MFGLSRKKKSAKRSHLLSFADGDDDDVQPPKEERKRKPKKNSAMLSFDPDDGAGENDGVDKKRKKRDKKKKSGMGYGGMILHDDDDEDVNMDDEVTGEAKSSYDTVTLEKLRMEQKRRKETDVPKDNLRFEQKEQQQQQRILDSNDKAEEEYISLSGNKSNSDPVVLTGDEAFAYAQDDEPVEFDHGLEQPRPSTSKPSSMDIDDTKVNEVPNEDIEEDNRQWEDNMARRAGVLPPSSPNNTKIEPQLHSLTSLAQIRSSLQPTISNLRNVSLDLETAIHRHESSLSSTREDLTKHQSTLEGHGDALEYYQLLRGELANWMGALRQVNDMVKLVHDARCNWESNVTLTMYQRGYEWSEDVRDVLRKKGLVDLVIGNVDDAPIEDVGVDEFGRDLSSMATMARTKRWEERRRHFANACSSAGKHTLTIPETMKCIHSDNISSDEVADWKQSSQALQEAATIIPSIVSDDYLSISNLCNLFFLWQDKYPEDYKSSYAEMTLVSMVSVLAEVEMCQRWNDLVFAVILDNKQKPAFQLNNIADFKWLQDLKQAAKNRSIEATDSSKLIHGVLEKFTESYLLRYMSVDSVVSEATARTQARHGLYDPISASETKWLCKLTRSLLAEYATVNADVANSFMTKVKTALLSLLKHNVATRATLIINTKEIVIQNDGYAMQNGDVFDGETNDSISYAIYSQANELRMLATNVLAHWYPLISNSLEHDDTTTSIVEFVLMEVISLRIVPIIHQFQSILEKCSGEEKQSFQDLQLSLVSKLYSAVMNAGLLEKEEWKVCTDSLRSAVQMMGLDVD